MVHYMTFTCATLSHGEEDIEVWQKLIPEEATQYDFLMDGLLALSLLHIAQENLSSSWEHTATAIQYQNSALQEYRIALNSITENNKHALFATSIVISILALAFSVPCPDPPNGSPQERVVSMVELPQGIGFINKAAGPSISQGKYRGLFRPFGRHQQLRLSEDIAQSLTELRGLAGGSNVSPGSKRCHTYISGIDSLEGAFSCMEASSYLGPVLAWPTSVSRELLELFKIGDPMAESIFMFYGVLLLHARDRWWAKDVGASLVEDLAGSIQGKGQQWAAVAQRARSIVAPAM